MEGFDMAKTTVLAMNYENSDNIEIQGKREQIQEHINNGYYIQEQRKGYYLLVKSSKIIVTLSNDDLTKTFNMKADILNYYEKQRLNETLFEKFKQDVEDGTISFTLDSNENYSLINNL